jgi:indolepyruvate ferredoxin oxidoreductase beta subunit
MTNVKNVFLAGVGGQGIILAGKVFSAGLVGAGYDVKMSEVHGMSQRGGSVTTQVRFGDKVYSPIIGKGEAHLILALEKMEALRWAEYLKLDGKIVLNDFAVPSAPILSGKSVYPENIVDSFKGKTDILVVKAKDIAEELGNLKVMNMVMVGAMVKALDLSHIDWDEIIRREVKEKFIDINILALKRGMEAI